MDTKEILIEIKRKPLFKMEVIKKKLISLDITITEMVNSFFKKSGDDRSEEVILQRYGIKDGEKHTLEEIGINYGITRERVRQIQVKTLKKMKMYQYKRPMIEQIESFIYQNGGIISDEKADKIFKNILTNNQIDGSNFLDLLCDLKWIQSYQIGDIKMYSAVFDKISLERISETIFTKIKNNEFGIEFNDLINKIKILNDISDPRLNKKELVLSYCLLDPRIEEHDNFQDSEKSGNEKKLIFKIFLPHGQLTKKWTESIKAILQEEGEPMHFTEITNRINDKLFDGDKKINVRRLHSLLISNSEFAHSGSRGTWGLTEWGIRKELTPELVSECLKKAGFPLHWKQIYNYVSKYKDTKPLNIMAILNSHPEFERKSRGIYGFKGMK